MFYKNDKIQRLIASGVNPDDFIVRSFNYYKQNRDYSRRDDTLDTLVSQLISIYYDLKPSELQFDNMRKSFAKRYVLNESSLEGVNYLTAHGKEELIGFAEMYHYMHTKECDDGFNIFTLKEFHEKLYSHSPYPEFGGCFRREFAYLAGGKTNLSDWTSIFRELCELDNDVFFLREMSKDVKALGDSSFILQYLDKCVELGCSLIKIHPFPDGNGRTIRCFINKLMEDGGLPSVYIRKEERDEYLRCMQKAMDFEDYTDINRFYRYKVCDSIVELDINTRTKSKTKPKPKDKGTELVK